MAHPVSHRRLRRQVQGTCHNVDIFAGARQQIDKALKARPVVPAVSANLDFTLFLRRNYEAAPNQSSRLLVCAKDFPRGPEGGPLAEIHLRKCMEARAHVILL